MEGLCVRFLFVAAREVEAFAFEFDLLASEAGSSEFVDELFGPGSDRVAAAEAAAVPLVAAAAAAELVASVVE